MTDKELKEEIRKILLHEEFIKLSMLKHHNTTRLVHTLNVTICSYNFAKKFNLNIDYNSLIRGCMLHDFFLYDQYKCPKGHLHAFYHPKDSVKNAKKYFNINNIEEDMIKKHMFPCYFGFPKYKETWIILLCDKYCATMEVFCKKNYMLEKYSKKENLQKLEKNIFKVKEFLSI